MHRHRPVPLRVPPPSSKLAFVQLRGRGGVTPLSSLPSSAVSTGGRSSRFRALDSDRGDRVTQIEEAHRGAAALSPNRSIALAISGGSVGSVGRVAQTAPLPGRAAFAIGLVALSAGLQVSTPSLSQASLPVGIPNPHMALLSNAPQRSGAPAIGPLFLSCLWLRTPVDTFFACSSKPLRLAHTARPDDAAFFSLASSHSHNHNRSASAM